MAKKTKQDGMKVEEFSEMIDKGIKKRLGDYDEIALSDTYLDNEEDEDIYEEKLNEQLNNDVFAVGEEKQSKGDLIQYTIKKNGEYLGVKHHPYDWERLQKEYGGGQYQVSARSSQLKRFVKHETRAVADIPRQSQESAALSNILEVLKENNSRHQPQQPNFMEMFALLSKMNESNKVESSSMAQAMSTSQSTMMTAIMGLITQMNTSTQKMMMEMTKANQDTATKLSDNTNKMFDKFNDRFEKIMDKIDRKPKNEGLSLIEIMKMQKDAQKEGFDMFEKINRISEEKASERMDIIEELKSHGGIKEDKKSLTETLIESLLPPIAASIKSNAGRSLTPTTQLGYPAPQPRQPIKRVANTQQGAQTKATNVPQSTQSRQNNSTSQRPHNVNSLGLPTFGAKKIEEVPAMFSTELIEKILEPVIINALQTSESTEKTAAGVITALEENKIPVKNFLKLYGKDNIIKLVEKYSLPKEAIEWFEGIYANIQDVTRESGSDRS